MSLICKLFGHAIPRYGFIENGPEDGVGRIHCPVKARCERCGKVVKLCTVHLHSGYETRFTGSDNLKFVRLPFPEKNNERY